MELEPAFGHAGGENGAEEVVGGVEIAAGQCADGGEDLCAGGGLYGSAGCEHGFHDIDAGSEVEGDGLAGFPVGGDLEDGGAAEAAVGDEHLLSKGGVWKGRAWVATAAGGGDGLSGGDGRRSNFGAEAGEVAPAVAVVWIEDEGDEGGAGFDDAEAELSGDVVAEGGGAHLGDGEAAGGDDYGLCDEGAGGGFEAEGGVAGEGEDAGAEEGGDMGGGALALEHGGDVVGGAVAEELAEGFFVVRNAVLLDEGDDVGRGEGGEGGLGEVRILGEEVFGAGVEVGEVAAASAGDENFFAGFFGVVDEEGAAATAAGFDGAHKACGSGTEDGYVDVFWGRLVVAGLGLRRHSSHFRCGDWFDVVGWAVVGWGCFHEPLVRPCHPLVAVILGTPVAIMGCMSVTQ